MPVRKQKITRLYRSLFGLGLASVLFIQPLAYCQAPQAAPVPKLKLQTPKLAPAPVRGSHEADGPSPQVAPGGANTAKNMGLAGEDMYPVIGRLEDVTFGKDNSALLVSDRLSRLEQAVFQKTFPEESLFSRTERLKETLIGSHVNPNTPPPQNPSPYYSPLPNQQPGLAPYQQSYQQPYGSFGSNSYPNPISGSESASGMPELEGGKEDMDESIWQQPMYQKALPVDKLRDFALHLINEDRNQLGAPPMEWDEVANKVADDHVADLTGRNTISHFNGRGENPDFRYTRAGGNDAMQESLVSIRDPRYMKPNRASIAKIIKTMKERQDDREALFSPDRTHLGFSMGLSKSKDRLLSCMEMVTRHGEMNPLPEAVKIGDKIEVKGVVVEPYRFNRLTLAWEGLSADGTLTGDPSEGMDESDEADEAMPYFPPLDYVAYAKKAERDNDKAIAVLKTAGVLAAIAGGVFIPPVALAAPLIAMSGSAGEPKAYSDIPIKGGIKTDGAEFHGRVAITNKGKGGLYYLTVWASDGLNSKPIPISRRTLIARDEVPIEKAVDKNSENMGAGI